MMLLVLSMLQGLYSTRGPVRLMRPAIEGRMVIAHCLKLVFLKPFSEVAVLSRELPCQDPQPHPREHKYNKLQNKLQDSLTT